MQQLVKARKNGATKADKTKARLIEVTKRLIQEHGSDRITLRSIAASARMKAGSIYYHFNSKDEIIRTVLESGVGGARKAVLRAIDEAGPTARRSCGCAPPWAPISNTPSRSTSRRGSKPCGGCPSACATTT